MRKAFSEKGIHFFSNSRLLVTLMCYFILKEKNIYGSPSWPPLSPDITVCPHVPCHYIPVLRCSARKGTFYLDHLYLQLLLVLLW